MPLAAAARAAGHDVHFATAGEFVTKLAALGYRTHLVGLTIEEARDVMTGGRGIPAGDDGRPDLDVAGELFAGVLARATATDLRRLLPHLAPDLVVYEGYDVGAPVAGHAAGIPVVCHPVSPDLPAPVLDAIFGRITALWAEHGFATPALDVQRGDAFVDIFPASLQPDTTGVHPGRIPMRPIAFCEPGAAAPRWIGRTDRPLVYLTLGTVVASDDVLQTAIAGLAGLDADVLVALGSAEGSDLGSLPANVRVESFVDQPAVMERADLAVHHGGSGTVLGALLAGVPQLLLPRGADQFFNADLMAAAGLAGVIEPRGLTPAALARAARPLLGRLPAAAAAARTELESRPDPSVVVEQLIERFDLDRSIDAA
jgi:UDP:flavonoid glycosyltransferase YjiC (YdhE family)